MGEIILEGGIEEIANHREELKELHYWATINDKTDCTKINKLLQVRNLVINQELRQRIDSWYDSSKPETIAS